MGYNVSNRRMRSSMFSKRNMNYGSKALGNIFIGLLGTGVLVGKGIGAAIEEGARNAQIEQKPIFKEAKKQNKAQDKEQRKKRSVWEWIGITLLWVCGAALLAVILYYVFYLVFAILLFLAVAAKR